MRGHQKTWPNFWNEMSSFHLPFVKQSPEKEKRKLKLVSRNKTSVDGAQNNS